MLQAAESHRLPGEDPGNFESCTYRFEDLEIDCAQGCLKKNSKEQYIRQQSFQVLLYLLERRHRLVSKEELIEKFWHGAAVTDNAVVQCIADIRKALGDDPRHSRFIKTVPKLGYRFIASVEKKTAEPGPVSLERTQAASSMGHTGEARRSKWSRTRTALALVLIAAALSLSIDFAARKMLAHRAADDAKTGLPDVITKDFEAYRYYSLGVSKAQNFENAEAVKLFEKAIQRDPQFAMAYARIGYAYSVTDFLPEKGRPYLEKAFQLSDRLTEKDRLYVAAWYAIAREDYLVAISTLRQITAKYPLELEAQTRLARLLLREEQPEQAIAVIQQGLDADPGAGDLYNVLGMCFLGLHRYDEAISAHQRYVQVSPKEPNAHDSLGMSYEQSGRYADAKTEYLVALSMKPNFEPAMIHLADVYAQEGQYDSAIFQYQRYISVTQSDAARAVAYGSMAQVYRRKRDIRAGEEAAHNERRYNPGAVWNSLLFALDRGDTANAAALQHSLFENVPYPERGVRQELRSYDYYLGTLALRDGQRADAINHFKQALRHLPPSSGLDLYEDCLANAYLQLGDLDHALAEYERIRGLNPNYPLVDYRLGQIYEWHGQRDEARAAYRRFLASWKDADPDIREILDAQNKVKAGTQSSGQ